MISDRQVPWRSVVFSAWLCALAARGETPAAEAERRVEDMSWGPVRAFVETVPKAVRLDRSLHLCVRIAAPSEIDVSLPAIEGRIEGFTVEAVFDEEPVREGPVTVRRRRAQLSPVISERYRLAPLAVQYTDHGRNPAVRGWFPTREVVFEVVPPLRAPPAELGARAMRPVPIPPSPAQAGAWSGLAVLALVLATGLGRAALAMSRLVRQHRMSPRGQALRELRRLLASSLVADGRCKDFYVELTMVVRRYIERRHAVRAPEQTTEEFLAGVADDPRFAPDRVRLLRDLLSGADLVKFAARVPDRRTIDGAVAAARGYIDADRRHEAEGA